MKKIILSTGFWALLSLTFTFSQDVVFSFTVDNSNATNSVVSVYAQFDGTGNPNAVAFSAGFYYDSTEATTAFGSVNITPLSSLGWNPGMSFSNLPSNNPMVPITHNKRVQVSATDFLFQGTNFPTTPTLLITITFNKTIGTPLVGGDIYMGAGTDTDPFPGLTYVDNTEAEYIVIVVGPREAILPIELISFEAEKFEKHHSKLSWATSSEINSSHFNVYRSLDNKTWANIGKVNAHGNSQIIQNYEFVDENVYNGTDSRFTAYYRLQSVDFDNQSKVSPIKSVVFAGSGSNTGREVSVYPNPSSEGVQLEWDGDRVDQPTSLEFYDSKGTLVYSSKIPENTNQQYIDFDQTSIIPGLYILRLLNGTDAIEHKQIIVTQR